MPETIPHTGRISGKKGGLVQFFIMQKGAGRKGPVPARKILTTVNMSVIYHI